MLSRPLRRSEPCQPSRKPRLRTSACGPAGPPGRSQSQCHCRRLPASSPMTCARSHHTLGSEDHREVSPQIAELHTRRTGLDQRTRTRPAFPLPTPGGRPSSGTPTKPPLGCSAQFTPIDPKHLPRRHWALLGPHGAWLSSGLLWVLLASGLPSSEPTSLWVRVAGPRPRRPEPNWAQLCWKREWGGGRMGERESRQHPGVGRRMGGQRVRCGWMGGEGRKDRRKEVTDG